MGGAIAMVVSDLDGTLLDSRGRLGEGNRAALAAVGRAGVLRVVATGRSLWSLRQVLAPEAPIDYAIFSSGVGVLAWPRGRLLRLRAMRRREALEAVRVARALGLDLMVHAAAPANHHFFYLRGARRARPNPDFARRCRRYRRYARPWPGFLPGRTRVSQLVAIEPPGGPSRHRELAARLRGLEVVRTTSPLDHRSRWTEVFPPGVSKSSAAAWLCARHGIDPGAVLALGNDYNDRDLLAWAGQARVVGNAVAALRERYPVVADNDRQGVAEALAAWLGGKVACG